MRGGPPLWPRWFFETNKGRGDSELVGGAQGPNLCGLLPCALSAGEAFSFKYSPGKLRGNQYKKMMTREELEEEQR